MPADAPTDGLNPDQLDAVVHRGGPLLVVAGAGSGKTRVLTHRIAHLIHEGVHPSRILAITFTNKAADEMRQRVAALVGPVARTMWVSTFHSACVRILRANADRLGYPRQFSIYDQADAVRLTGYVIRDLHLDAKRFTPRGVHGLISLWKNELLTPDDVAARAQHIFDRKHADVYAEYQARLLKAGAMDFDDLLVNTVRLLRDHPDVLEHYRERFEHILVDEYQDTNQAQNEIVLLLAGGHHNVTVVGDTDQCLPAGTMVGRRPATCRSSRWRSATWCRRRRRNATRVGTVTHVHRSRTDEPLVRVATVDGVMLTATAQHIVPARIVPMAGSHLVYLMHRADRGYRIGRTTGGAGTRRTRSGRSPRTEHQEHADAMWILRCARRVAEASFWEAWFAATYGLPTACFHANGRSLAMDDEWLQRLYDGIDTPTRAKALMHDLQLHPDFPHHRPQNGPAVDDQPDDVLRRPWDAAYHRVQWSSSRPMSSLGSSRGIALRPGKAGMRYETSWKDYAARSTMRSGSPRPVVCTSAGGWRSARRVFDLMPMSHVRRGHGGRGRARRRAPGRRSSTAPFSWSPRSETCSTSRSRRRTATSPTGCSCTTRVYRFRGADFRNILQFEEAFPEVTTVVLDQNYRSTQTILDAANAVIANNAARKPKNLWTDAGSGHRIVRYHAEDEGDEATFVASTARQLHDDHAIELARARRALPHQRPEPRRRGGDDAPRRARTRSSAARASTTGARSRTPWRTCGRSSTRPTRSASSACSTCPSAASATPASPSSTRSPPPRASGSSTRCAGPHDAGVTGPAVRGIESFVASARRARRDGRATTTSDPATCCRRRSSAPATSPSWRPRTPSSPPGGWRTSASSSGRRGSSPCSTSSSSRSRSSPTPTRSPTTTRSC